jgi:hypothetical protein
MSRIYFSIGSNIHSSFTWCTTNVMCTPDSACAMFFTSISVSGLQCLRVESAHHFHIWFQWLDELRRGPRSSQAYEGSMWNHPGSTGITLSISQTVKPFQYYLKWTNKLNCLLQSGHFVFIENPSAFHSAVFYACRRFLSPDPDSESLPEGLTSA